MTTGENVIQEEGPGHHVQSGAHQQHMRPAQLLTQCPAHDTHSVDIHPLNEIQGLVLALPPTMTLGNSWNHLSPFVQEYAEMYPVTKVHGYRLLCPAG